MVIVVLRVRILRINGIFLEFKNIMEVGIRWLVKGKFKV